MKSVARCRILGKRTLLAKQFAKYLVVGGCSFIAYIGTQVLVVELWERSVVAATALAFCVGTIVSYAGNSCWSFESKPTKENFIAFLLVVLFGLALNILIAAVMDRMGVHYLLISLAIFTLIPIVNFLGHRHITFAGGGAKK